MLKAVGIEKSYGDLKVLKGVSLEVNKGELVSIVGSSGAGKSTLLHILGTLDIPQKGELYINKTKISGLRHRQLAHFRNKNIGFVFQFHNLLPEFTALENVCLPGFIGDFKDADVKKRANTLLEMLGLSDRKNHKPSELSGGEQQRTAVARALVNAPLIVFADEPSGNLDSTNAKELHNLFISLKKETQQTFVVVTHNEDFANMADRKIVMKDGLILN